MPGIGDLVSWQTAMGDPVTVGEVNVTPQSWALRLRWPSGGCVWNRPAAVLVERGGDVQRIPIVDVTRLVQVACYGLSGVLMLVAGLATVRHWKRR